MCEAKHCAHTVQHMCWLSICACCAGSAYVHGLAHVKGDFVVIMDADLSHHVSANQPSLSLAHQAPCALGTCAPSCD